MGAKVSTLLFRPPNPTHMSEENYFYLDVDVVTPLAVPGVEGGGPCSMGCVPNPDSDLASLDSSFLNDDYSSNGQMKNVRNGNKYKIPAFYIRRRNATQTILFSHGNAEDLGMMFERMKELAKKLSVNIMAYDYTGYGMSLPRGEKPSENMCYRNIDAAYQYLTQERKCPPSSIILYGRSLGGGPSCYLAAKTAMQGHSVGGLILHSAFLSVYKVVTDMNGLDMRLVGDMFNNEKRAKNIRCPTIIIHGKRDLVVPFWHAPRLLGSIPAEFRWKPMYVEDLGHNSIESKMRLEYVDALTNFINGTREMKEMNAPIHRDFRASAEDVQDNVNFYVNKMWLNHAKHALTEALVGKSSSKPASSASGNSVESSHNYSRNGKLMLSSRGRAYDPSTFENVNASPKIHTRSFGGAGVQYSPDNFHLSDARDEEDEFAPWKEDRDEETAHHPISRSPTTPAEELTPLANDRTRTGTRESRPRSEASIDKPKPSPRARHSSSSPTSPRKAPSRSQSAIATSQRKAKSPSRSQSTISKTEYSAKRLEAEYFSQQLKRQQELNRQNELMRQYESGRNKSNSMQLSATSQRQKRGGRNLSMYEM